MACAHGTDGHLQTTGDAIIGLKPIWFACHHLPPTYGWGFWRTCPLWSNGKGSGVATATFDTRVVFITSKRNCVPFLRSVFEAYHRCKKKKIDDKKIKN